VLRGADAGQVRHGLDLELVLDARHQFDRAVAGAPAGAVGDGDERGLQWLQPLDRLEQAGDSFIRLRREELEGEAGIYALEDSADLHDSLRPPFQRLARQVPNARGRSEDTPQ